MSGGGIDWARRHLYDLIDLFFPAICPVCTDQRAEDAGIGFCFNCSADITPLPVGRCSRCALPFFASSTSSHLCADCSRISPPFHSVHAVGLYDGSLKQALQRFKYSGAIDLDRVLARLLQGVLPALDSAAIIVPVPLHPRRLRQRGYNQSLLLARILAHNLQTSLNHGMLMRNLDTHSQQGLDAKQRAQNLRGAFGCHCVLNGETLLLIDDVMTTGATVAACSQALLDAGAGQVIVGVVARAPRH